MDAKQNLTTDWQDSVNFLLGLGLFLSPWALGYESEGSATLSAASGRNGSASFWVPG